MVILTNWTLQVFRFYEDGTESGSTASAAQNTNVTRTDGVDSAVVHLRVAIWDGLGGGGGATDDWQLQVSRNGGAYGNVTSATSYVQGYNSSSLTDAGSTTQRLSGATGSFGAGEISEDGLVDDLLVASSTNTELLYSLTVVYADCSNGDTLDFRVLMNGATITYDRVPRITVAKSTSFTVTPTGKLTINGNGVQRVGAVLTAGGRLTFNGIATANNLASYSFEGGGGVGQVLAPETLTRVSGTFNAVGGGIGQTTTVETIAVVTGVFTATGGNLGGVTAPESNFQVGYLYDDAAGAVGGMFADEGGDAEVEDGGGEGNGGNTTQIIESFVPCCTLPDKTPPTNCCDCVSYTWEWWQITEVDPYEEAICQGGLGGSFTFPLTLGCALNTTSALRFLGPNPNLSGGESIWAPQSNRCGWISWPYVPTAWGGGAGVAPNSEYIGCCYLDLSGTQCVKPVGWSMGCARATTSVYTPPLTAWIGDCVECQDLWCGDASEWGSLEDCETYDTNCHCCTDPEPVQFVTEQQCIDYPCNDCHEVILSPHVYIPPFPTAWYLSYFGPCGCGKTYISTTSDHPLYAFYEPTSGLDNLDACGNYYYDSFGALDATGPFDCTSGGRFVLMNFVQQPYLMGDCSYPIHPCNQPTNIYNGYDPPCAKECNGYNFADCHPGCIETGLYLEVKPIPSNRVLPHTNWFPTDDNANMLCCPSSDSSGVPTDPEIIYQMTLAQGNTLHFQFKMFKGLFLQVDEVTWKINYPPLSFELKKDGDRYLVNGIVCKVLLDDPLMLEVMVYEHLLEIHGN